MRPINILILVSTHVLLLTYAIEIIVPHEDVPPSTSGNRIGTAGEGGSSSSGEGCLGTSCGSHGISSEGEGGGNSIGDTTNPGNPARVPGSSSEDGPSESRINGSEVSEALEDIVEQVLSAVAGSSATSATSAPTPTAVAKSAGPNGQACITARSILSTCSVKTSGFLSAGNRVQASCLCYQPGRRSSSWVPDVFDDAISSCDRYVGTVTQPPTVSSAIAAERGFCSLLGNVRAVRAPTLTTLAATVSALPASTGFANRRASSEWLFMVVGMALGGMVL